MNSTTEVIQYTTCVVCNSKNIELDFPTQDYSVSGEAFEIYKCKDCSFHFTQAIPAPEAIGRYYKSEDYISHSNTKKGLINQLYHVVRDYMLGKKHQLVKSLAKGNQLLDIGCGTGHFLNFMKEKGYQTQGVEVDDDARAFGQKEFGLDVSSPAALFDGSLNSPFDAITMWHVLEHIHLLDDNMKAIRSLLADDGFLIIAVPNRESYDAQYYKQHWAAYDVPRHLWHFSPTTMDKIASKNGFRIQSLSKLPFDSFYTSLLSEKYKENKLFLFSGFTIGLLSYLKSVMDVKKASSVIYIMQKS
ncbi:MAG: class I SAM-dependent methyltransferase [Bacteroidota bacterium]